jgi:1,2-phenylacetyl-CoA epoxidase catalytic subunit
MEKLGAPTGIKITTEESFHMNEMPNGDWLVEIHSTTNGSSQMILRKEAMPHIRDMLNKSVKGEVA